MGQVHPLEFSRSSSHNLYCALCRYDKVTNLELHNITTS
jgi:hypothetical protein